MRHPHYNGRKAETVPSVGSRLAGVVKPSYGKPKLKRETLNGTVACSTRRDGYGMVELQALSPYRMGRTEHDAVISRQSFARTANKFVAKCNKRPMIPRLIKPA